MSLLVNLTQKIDKLLNQKTISIITRVKKMLKFELNKNYISLLTNNFYLSKNEFESEIQLLKTQNNLIRLGYLTPKTLGTPRYTYSITRSTVC